MSNYIALDLGTKTGFCIFLGEDGVTIPIASGTRNFNQPKNAHIGRRFVCFRDWLISVIRKYEIKGVYYEQVYAHSGIQPAHVYGGFLYHIAAICDDFNIPMRGINVSTIKKHVTGHGQASKLDVIETVTKYNFHPIDDNEADAIAIMLTASEL